MTQASAGNVRIDSQTFREILPEIGTGMAAIAQAIRKSGLEAGLVELLKIRVSQMNGCAFCVQYHLNDARKLNIPAEKLDLLATWREAGLFTERERAALHWAERVTLLAARRVSDKAFESLKEHFSEREIVFLTAAVGQINFWNRVAAPFRFAPPIPDSSV